MQPILIIQGGAGDIPDSRVEGKLSGVKYAAEIGYEVLLTTNNPLEAVEAAIKAMELNDHFNAGYGSVLTNTGKVEMEASLMDSSGRVGCVSLIDNIMHPISLARRVLEKTPHNFLAGANAMKFAESEGFGIVSPSALVTPFAKEALEEWKTLGNVKFAKTEVGTVGAVAINSDGQLVAGTSTGGITGKFEGRIGDTPIIGGGNYCNKDAAVSATGHGETIMKACLSHDIVKRYEFQSPKSAQEATKQACERMTEEYEGTGGAITVTKTGDVGIFFTSNRMAWALKKDRSNVAFGIERGETRSEQSPTVI